MSKAFEVCLALKQSGVTGVNLARVFAQIAHGKQKRKYSDEPDGELYIGHLDEVAHIMQTGGRCVDEITQNVAYLHDVLEDTDATKEEIEVLFGKECADSVVMLTDVSKPSDGNRAVRKAIDRDHLAKASPLAKAVKVADLLSNIVSIPESEPFRKVFEKEAHLLLKVLNKCSCKTRRNPSCFCFITKHIVREYLNPVLRKEDWTTNNWYPWR